MSSLEALPLIAFYKVSSPLNVHIDFDQHAVARAIGAIAVAYDPAIPTIAGGCEVSFRPRGGLWQIGRHRQLCVNTRGGFAAAAARRARWPRWRQAAEQ
jgi:hypothetical protein